MRRTKSIWLWALAALWLVAGTAPARAAVEAVKGGVKFTYRDQYAGAVFLAGDFNGWNGTATPMQKDNGVWSVVVPLSPGSHEYKFVIDGQWVADPDNPVTVGDFGNSGLEVAADGSLKVMKATSNTELSPKIYLGSRYISLFQLARSQDPAKEWNFDRPQFDVDFDFTIRMNEALTAHVLTNINNENQNVQLWETNLVFDRGSLLLDTEDIRLMAFDNDSLASFDDPLVLLGNVGIYDHAWGYDKQGVSFWKSWQGFDAQLVYSDNFVTGGTTGGSVDPDDLRLGGERLASRAELYSFADTDGAKDVLGLRIKRNLRPDRLTLGASLRVDRGANPGQYGYSVLRGGAATLPDTVDIRYYDDTEEDWKAGGLDFDYRNDPAGLDLRGEILIGESYINTGPGQGESVFLDADGNETGSAVFSAPDDDIRLDTSKRLLVDGHYYAFRGWHWRGGFEFQDHDLSAIANDSLRAVYSRVATWKLDLEFDGEEWMRWPWKAGLGVAVYDFAYEADAPWNSQIWFDYNNFWLEQGEHEITVDRLVMLGGDDVVSWRPRAEWTFHEPRNATVRYAGILNATKLGRKPKYWENRFQLHYEFSRRLHLNTDSRWVRYDDPVLALEETFLSHFVEFKYMFTPEVEVGLSYGVDPYVIDPVTNQYADIGRDFFLFERGANGATARDRYLELGSILDRAESELESERRFQLEAIVRF